jgi:hypothetical protein
MIMMVFSWRICEADSLRRYSSSSRPQRFFKVRRPNPRNHHHQNQGFNGDDYPPESFSGFLPKTLPIPHSAPSRKHNVYGLQSTNSHRCPWSSSTRYLNIYTYTYIYIYIYIYISIIYICIITEI